MNVISICKMWYNATISFMTYFIVNYDSFIFRWVAVLLHFLNILQIYCVNTKRKYVKYVSSAFLCIHVSMYLFSVAVLCKNVSYLFTIFISNVSSEIKVEGWWWKSCNGLPSCREGIGSSITMTLQRTSTFYYYNKVKSKM